MAMHALAARPSNSFGIKGIPDPIRRQQAVLLAAHMIFDDVPYATIRFMTKVYTLFLEKKQVTAKAMAAIYKCSPQAAGKHVKKLVDCGYLDRIHYRAWSVNSEYLQYLGQV